MKIEVGKYYRTRDGRKVECTEYDGDDLCGYPYLFDDCVWRTLGGVVRLGGDETGQDLIAEWTDTPEVGTLSEIGAQVGDVVEWVSKKGGIPYTDKHSGTLHTVQSGGWVMLNRADYYWGYIGEKEVGDIQWRIVSRASDAKPTCPVITVTTKRIVPGNYGHVWIDWVEGGTVCLGLRNNALKKMDAVGLSRAELIAARDVFNQLIDAMEGQQ